MSEPVGKPHIGKTKLISEAGRLLKIHQRFAVTAFSAMYYANDVNCRWEAVRCGFLKSCHRALSVLLTACSQFQIDS